MFRNVTSKLLIMIIRTIYSLLFIIYTHDIVTATYTQVSLYLCVCFHHIYHTNNHMYTCIIYVYIYIYIYIRV